MSILNKHLCRFIITVDVLLHRETARGVVIIHLYRKLDTKYQISRFSLADLAAILCLNGESRVYYHAYGKYTDGLGVNDTTEICGPQKL